jgi:hypothetical protein
MSITIIFKLINHYHKPLDDLISQIYIWTFNKHVYNSEV